MEFTIETLVKYLRDSVLVQDESMATDPAWLGISDDDLEVVLNVARHRDFPNQVLEDLAPGVVYPLMLVAKKELYHRLAVKYAPQYNIKADPGGDLYKTQRFEHIIQLIRETEEELQNYYDNGYFGEDGIGDLDEGGNASRNTVYVREALIPNRYFSRRSYGLYTAPSVKVSVEGIGSNSVQLSWRSSSVRAFRRYRVFIDTQEPLDPYNNNKVKPSAKMVTCTVDQRNTTTEIIGLEPETEYYVLVVCEELNGIKGYGGVVFNTPPPIMEDEDPDTGEQEPDGDGEEGEP